MICRNLCLDSKLLMSDEVQFVVTQLSKMADLYCNGVCYCWEAITNATYSPSDTYQDFITKHRNSCVEWKRRVDVCANAVWTLFNDVDNKVRKILQPDTEAKTALRNAMVDTRNKAQLAKEKAKLCVIEFYRIYDRILSEDERLESRFAD